MFKRTLTRCPLFLFILYLFRSFLLKSLIITLWAEGKVLSIDRIYTTFPEYCSTPPTIKVFIKSEGIQSILRQKGDLKVFETPVTIYNQHLLFIDITDNNNLKCHKVNIEW